MNFATYFVQLMWCRLSGCRPFGSDSEGYLLYIASSNKSCDDFAPNINLFGLMLPHGVLNVATALESG